MNYLMIILPKMLSFAILIALGILCARKHIIQEEGQATLSGFLLKLVLPCLIISLMSDRGTTFASLYVYRRFILCQISVYIILACVGILTSRILKLQYPTSVVHAGEMMCDNYAFFVIPLVMALYGPDNGQELIPIGSVVDTIMVWTLGISIFTSGKKDPNVRTFGFGNLIDSLLRLGKKLINPIMISIVGMLIINSVGITLPGPVLEVCTNIGAISSSLGLLYVGAHICFMPKGNTAAIKRSFLIVVLKLLLIPILLYLIFSRFMSDSETIVLTLIAAAPCMTTSCMIANQYHLDEDYAAAAVFVTTLSCIVTIPLLFLMITLLKI